MSLLWAVFHVNVACTLSRWPVVGACPWSIFHGHMVVPHRHIGPFTIQTYSIWKDGLLFCKNLIFAYRLTYKFFVLLIRQIDFFLEKNKIWRFCSNSKIEIEKIFGLSSCVSVKSGKLEWTSVTKARTWSRAPPVWKFFQKWKKWKKWNKWKVCNQNFSTRKSVCNAKVHFSLTPGANRKKFPIL